MPSKVQDIENGLKTSANFSELSAEEKEWFYWTNYSRMRPKAFWDSVVVPILKTYPNLVSSYTASLKSDLYKTPSLTLIVPQKKLLELARGHANDLARKKAPPSHSSTNGNSFQERMLKAGVIRCAGENISFGPANAVLALVFLYIDERLPDLGHRKSLLTPTYTQMGIGISTYPDNQVMVIQDFGCDQTP